jgi:two-component system NtrC family sensor kinase
MGPGVTVLPQSRRCSESALTEPHQAKIRPLNQYLTKSALWSFRGYESMGAPDRRERVLVVDDEPQILRALVDTLEDHFEVISTSQPQQALTWASEDRDLAVVISDQRMPGMSGAELFRRLRDVSAATRMLVTGYADVESVIRAVNEGKISSFINKPWTTGDLLLRVTQAATHFRLKRQLDEERQAVRDLMTSTPDAIYFTDSEHRFTRVNDALLKLMGFSDASQMLGHRRGEMVREGNASVEVEEQERLVWSDGEPRNITHEFMTSSGPRWFSTTKAATRAETGEIVGLVCIARDVTEGVKTDEALRISEQRLRLAFHASNAGLFDWNIRTNQVSYAPVTVSGSNRTVERTDEDFSSLETRIHPDDLPQLREAIKAHLELRQPFTKVAIRGLGPAGYRWYELNAQAAWDEQGRPLRLVGSSVDIDDLRQAQSRLVQAQKLEGIGQLAAGIAHEINTPAQYVTDNVTFLERAFSKLRKVLDAYQSLADAARSGSDTALSLEALDGAIAKNKLEYLLQQAPRALTQSLEGLAHVTSIVKAMKEFSHPSGVEKQPADIHEIIESSSVVARNEWKYVAEMQFDFDRALPAVPMIRNELSQVFLNLIVNAAHAIDAAQQAAASVELGKITIATCRVGDAVEIRVTDTGAGIPEQIRSRVFEPFFTTKEVGKGTGQGLAISYAVVVGKHRGSIGFESELGRGTTFIIRLPLTVSAKP